MGCPPVRGDNPRALASGLSYVQVDKHGITVDTTYISVDLAHHEIFYAEVGRGGISFVIICFSKSPGHINSTNLPCLTFVLPGDTSDSRNSSLPL